MEGVRGSRQQRGSLPFPVVGMPGSLGTVIRTLFFFLLVPGWVRTALQQLCLGTAAYCFDACEGFGLRDSCSRVSEGSWAGSRVMQTCWVTKPRWGLPHVRCVIHGSRSSWHMGMDFVSSHSWKPEIGPGLEAGEESGGRGSQ